MQVELSFNQFVELMIENLNSLEMRHKQCIARIRKTSQQEWEKYKNTNWFFRMLTLIKPMDTEVWVDSATKSHEESMKAMRDFINSPNRPLKIVLDHMEYMRLLDGTLIFTKYW